ncbi:PrpF protein [Vararia minispora EC-137]|uniref:PrpF protein n=1 Tax=Vararia minispora EC-137 TaxID=1314806 RepID=A0ACB8QSQ1_9AGAM|nr:PrpF protein [Vararia minispora EC-137]
MATRIVNLAATPNPLPAHFLRGGTSKGIFINRCYLPPDKRDWDRIFLGIMGSPDGEYGRQLDGMGGGISSLSKVVVVGPPQDPWKNADVEYTFAQVGVRDSVVDYSGNCGNLSSMVGVFAVDQDLCPHPASSDRVLPSSLTVRALNTNTSKIIETTFPVAVPGTVAKLDLEQASIAGVPGKASAIVLDFLEPAGAGTGKLLPTGSAIDTLPSPGGSVQASLVDATNPSIFVHDANLNSALGLAPFAPLDYSDPRVLDFLETIRQAGAVRMGLDPSAQAQPKIAVLSMPDEGDSAADIVVLALSMGVVHKAVPMTLALCLGVASNVPNSIPWRIMKEDGKDSTHMLRVRHPGGVVEVGAEFKADGTVRSAKAIRTGRRLMEGLVYW